jgi:hypothetical protein
MKIRVLQGSWWRLPLDIEEVRGRGGAALDAGGRQAVGEARGAEMRRRGEGEAGGGRWAVAAR